MGNKTNFALLLLLLATSATSYAKNWRFGIISDIHIGHGDDPPGLLRGAVAQLNRLAAEEKGLEFVFITGDVTHTGSTSYYGDQWTIARQILDGLDMTWFPMIGNHDIWSNNRSWQEPHPTGDQKFASMFRDKWVHPLVVNSTFANSPAWNEELGYENLFLNGQVSVPNPSGNGTLVFLGLDFNSRKLHFLPEFFWGAWPGADMYDFPGTTLRWMEERIAALDPDEVTEVVFLQHHPFTPTPWVIPHPEWAFTKEMLDKWRGTIEALPLPIEKYRHMFCGHFHVWDEEKAFADEPGMKKWEHFRQWETTGCVKEGGKGITLVTVDGDRGVIIDREKCCD